jgi:hypothetical protein
MKRIFRQRIFSLYGVPVVAGVFEGTGVCDAGTVAVGVKVIVGGWVGNAVGVTISSSR